MPAITSPLSALRLSGRLMVIQYACARFSRMTLSLSVIGLPVCLLPWVYVFGTGRGMTARAICGTQGPAMLPGVATVERSTGRERDGSGFFHPDLVVVERRPTNRRHRFAAGERIDAATADVIAIWVDRFGDQHAATQAVE